MRTQNMYKQNMYKQSMYKPQEGVHESVTPK